MREQLENAGETDLDFPIGIEKILIAEFVRGPKTSFNFKPDGIYQPWFWQEMVAQLDEESMQFVVEGDNVNRSRGLVGCKVQKADVYDHMMHSANKNDGKVHSICDFVLQREDGSIVSLHPDYTTTKVVCYEGALQPDHEIPRTGKGGTSGPGTFKYFKNKNVEVTLRFDAKKKQAMDRNTPQSRNVPHPWQAAASSSS